MARWLETGVARDPNELALLATAVVFFACVTKLVALCAAHGSPQVLNRPESEAEAEGDQQPQLAPDASRKLSQRFSPSGIQAKLSSFRKSSFRLNSSFSYPGGSFRHGGSFRYDCNQVDVVDAIHRVQPPQSEQEEIQESAPGTPAVWQKQILRGERCAPLEFSGLILYDEKGNHLPLRNNNNHNSSNNNNRYPLRS